MERGEKSPERGAPPPPVRAWSPAWVHEHNVVLGWCSALCPVPPRGLGCPHLALLTSLVFREKQGRVFLSDDIILPFFLCVYEVMNIFSA